MAVTDCLRRAIPLPMGEGILATTVLGKLPLFMK
jgi:hypothetical protein